MSEIASETGCVLFDVYTRFLSLSEGTLDTLYLSGDAVHLKEAGHQYVADMAAEVGNASAFTQPS
jgi:hypothetical protein